MNDYLRIIYSEDLDVQKYLWYMGIIIIFRLFDIGLTVVGVSFFGLEEKNILLASINSNLFIGLTVMILTNIAFLLSFHYLFMSKKIGFRALQATLLVFVLVVANNSLKIIGEGGIL